MAAAVPGGGQPGTGSGVGAGRAALFGADAFGIFGSAMLGMHLTPTGHVRKDVDFVV